MTVSGTLAQAVPILRSIYDRAFRRAGIANQLITSEMIAIARDLLNAALSELPSAGATLWTNDNILVGMRAGVPVCPLPAGTLEVNRVSVRQQTLTTGALSGVSPNWVLTATAAVAGQFIGVKVATAGIYTLAVDSSPDGVTWTQEATYEFQELFTNKWNWLEVMPDTQSVTKFRVRETTTLVAFPVTALCVTVGFGERPLSPMPEDDYSYIQNKRQQGNVNMYWADRQVDGPVLNLYNAPDATHEGHQLVVWRKRQIKDVGEMTSRVELPQRWIDALGWDLGWRLAAEISDAKKDPKEIKPFADLAIHKMAASESDGQSTSLAPDISMYTA